MGSFHYEKKDSLYGALKFLKEKSGVHLLAGGTDLIVGVREGRVQPSYVLDIKEIKECNILKEEEEGIKIGAAITLNQICVFEAVQKNIPILAEACHRVGSYPIRNRATLVGNICNASPAADTAPALLCLDAMVVIASLEGQDSNSSAQSWQPTGKYRKKQVSLRKVAIADFIIGPKKTILDKDEIVVSVEIPKPYPNGKGTYEKASRTYSVDLSTVGVAVQWDGNKVRVALGAVAPKPLRAKSVEKAVNELGERDFNKAAKEVIMDISPITDIRSSKDFRRHLAEVLVERSLEKTKGV